MNTRCEPIIIQGGMGVAVSGWQLARAVSTLGQLGVVSGTALEVVTLRRLQLGDPGGHMRRALAEFPFQEMADRVFERYFIAGGKSPEAPFATCSMHSERSSRQLQELVVAANFAEVYLAKEGHEGLVGINYLEKLQLPTLPSLFGAMLAGVDYVLMGAGIPRSIPGVLDRLADGEFAELPLKVVDAGAEDNYVTRFDPAVFSSGEVPWLTRPKFLAIVGSQTLATMLARKSNGRVDGFIVEGPTAGGHNAPPRGKPQLNKRGEPVYGARDVVDIQAMRDLQRPFWMAGAYGSPEKVVQALDAGATGVQVGTAFAFCQESGLGNDIKQRVLRMSCRGELDVFTDPVASPTGFPFKVLRLKETLSDSRCYLQRQRRCDLGFLRQAYKKPDGGLGWRCPADRMESYLRAGGKADDAVGRKCLCNGLLANVGLPQVRDGELERPLLTCGDDVQSILPRLISAGKLSYAAADVVQYLLKEVKPAKLAATIERN